MGLIIGKKIALVFVLPILILIVLGSLFYRNALKSIEYTHWVAHTADVTRAVMEMRSDIKDMETGQRGYLIVGKESYLDSYNAGLASLQQDINSVRQLTKDNPIQQKRVATLEPLIAIKTAGLKETINLRRTQGFEAAQAVVINDVDKKVMDDIRKIIKEMLAEEDGLLRARTKVQQAGFQSLNYISIVGILLALLFAVITGFLIYQVDIQVTKRKKAEEHYRSLFESIDEGFCVFEMIFDEQKKPIDYRFLEISPSFEKHTGLKGAQGKTMLEIAPQHEKYWAEIYGKVALTGQSIRFENRAEQLHRWYEVYAFRVGNPENRQVAALFKDITARRQAEKEAEQANQKMLEAMNIKSEFTSIVSHELRTPLTIIKESVNIVYDETTGPVNSDQKNFLETAKRNVDRLGRLINDVLDYQKLDAQKMQFRMEKQSINDVVKEVGTSFEVPLKNKGIKLKLELQDKLPNIKFDKDRIIQVLTNLLSNAMQFMEKGTVTLSTAKMGENAIKVSVQDEGIGIKEEDFGKLFQSFSQISTGTGRKTGGTGLGLALCKKIMEEHKGSIQVSSTVGKGSTFYFILPIADRRT